ncbi:hypothetical protein E4U42_004182 [Claviceps africana]|uniref:Trafficking protein particle complex subunit 11 domain-containing protein n=1 Tax=Claviceps africana TaxID=83212 RepID=A0A8K0NH71_9HYPO|nr:hypothetical protein E4U42_004182 [Claviceps africana]
MEGYPQGSLDHNVPFLVASGLNDAEPHLDLAGELGSQGLVVKSDLPPLDTRESQLLDKYFREIDSRGSSWTVVPRDEPYRLRIKTVGRSYLLPPRKTTLPDAPDLSDSNARLHSPFSPLSHVSPLYPDGLIDSLWVKKHQELVPSVFVCFYKLNHDNRLKADVSQIKATFARYGFRTRVAIVLFGDEDSGTAELTDDVQDRLEAIRRGAALDPKSIFYIPTQETPAELKRVIDNILAILYSNAIEYYRDLGRRARKKRARGVAPLPTIRPTSGTSHTLSLPDWNFRYDFKTAVFAEFRQELDAAMRSFEQAYEIILGQDVLDVIPNWSPRWDEGRRLADIVSIRCLRLHLWMGHTSLAVRRWQTHRDRIGDFVDRLGRGTNTYSWQAWEARWATVMAHLIEKVEVPGLVPASMTIFLPPEKAVLGERLQPWELLHHTGYWYRIAARHLAARRTLARMMPSEHRQAPDSSSATSSAGNYDTYMCPPPHEEYPLDPGQGGVNHARLIIDCLTTSRSQFQARKQLRIASELSLECAKEMASLGSWEEVAAVLRPVWDDMSFRSDNWLDIAEDLCWLLRKAAKKSGQAHLVVAVDWELMNKRFPKRQHWSYDLSQSLEGMTVDARPSVELSDDVASPLISSSFVFRTKDSKAGDYCKAQLALTSNAMPGARPLCLSSVRIEFVDGLKPLVITHTPSEAGEGASSKTHLVEVVLEEEAPTERDSDELPSLFTGFSDLMLTAGQTRVLEMAIPLREPGEAEVSSVVLRYETEAFDLRHTSAFRDTDPVAGWYVRGDDKPRTLRAHARTLRIDPRPPKLQMTLLEPSTQFYTDEIVHMDVELRNDEDEAARVKIDAQLVGGAVPSFTLQLGEEKFAADAMVAVEDDDEDEETQTRSVTATVGAIARGASAKIRLEICPTSAPSTLDLHLRATYHLESDPATTILQVLPLKLTTVAPFEANYDLMPRLHPDPWPSLFDCDGIPIPGAEDDDDDDDDDDEAAATATATATRPKGLAQQWCLMCHYASFATEDLVVAGMETQVVSCTGAARCHVLTRPEQGAAAAGDGITVSPRKMYEAQFYLVAQKQSLDDRQPVTLELALIIRWKRQRKKPPPGADMAAEDGVAEDGVNTTVMPVGQFLVLGSEPRVLATATMQPGGPAAPASLVHLDITIENPSSHFLTFGLNMDPSDAFGFSGPKQTTVHLLPVSRRSIRYRLLPFVAGDYIRPGIVVRDKYFQKVLRIIPTGDMKIDKDGLLVWIPQG